MREEPLVTEIGRDVAVEMPRRLSRKASRDLTRRRLLDAAAAVFARRGFEGASLDEIAAVAGFTRGAIYANFDGKVGLFVALMERRIDTQADAQEVLLEGVATAGESMALVEADAETARQAEPSWTVLAIEFWLYALRHTDAVPSLERLYERQQGRVAALIARKFREGNEDPPMPAEDLATLSEALGTALGIMSRIAPRTVSSHLYSRAMTALMSGGTKHSKTGDGR